VWDINFDSDTNIVEVTVRRLRAKVDDPFETKLIHTVRGEGCGLRAGTSPRATFLPFKSSELKPSRYAGGASLYWLVIGIFISREALNKFEFKMRQGANKKYRRSIYVICKEIFFVSNAVS
jgi:hypothetical protein